jgi:ribosomal protein S12 methylthiotransferase
MQAVEFDRVGIFTYSQEEGTPANALPNQIPEPIKRERYSRAMLVQQEISRRKNSQWIGQELTVLVEGETIEPKKRGERPLVVGRSYRDAPEIDGLVLAWGEAQPGDLVRVRITQATEYDLWGEVVGPVSLGLERPEQAANGGRP